MQLTQTQNLLSQYELEVEQLRKDLQLQLMNKKDLVAWKVQHAKMLDDLTKKVKRYEKYGQNEIEKLISDHERRMQQQQRAPGAGDSASPAAGGERPATSASGLSAGEADSPRTGGGGGGGAGGRASAGLQRAASAASKVEWDRLQEQLRRERGLKEKAFAKIDELRMGGDSASGESLVWQRKYFEAASELQRCVKELEQCRATMVGAGVMPPHSSHDAVGARSVHTPSLLRTFHSVSGAAVSGLGVGESTTVSAIPLPPASSSPSTGSAQFTATNRPATTQPGSRPPPASRATALRGAGGVPASR